MKHFFTNKLFIATVSFIVGGVSVFGLTRHFMQNKIDQQKSETPLGTEQFFDDFFNNDFFGRSRDPFEEMRRMQKEMFKKLNDDRSFPGTFDRWYQRKFGGGDSGEIRQREDDEYLYYDLDLKDQVPKELNVKVQDGQILIDGKIEAKEQKEGINQFYSSSFHRSFPVPSGVEGEKFKMEQEGNKIIIKLPKSKL